MARIMLIYLVSAH